MRAKTSVTLPRDLIESIDRVDSNRSAFLERAARIYLEHLRRRQRDERDARILDRSFARLNKEALDVLDYQALP